MTVTSPLIYAGPGRRVVAFGFDFLLIGAYILLLLAVGVSANAVAGRLPFLESPIAMNLLAFITLVLPAVLYFAVQEGSSHQATWGKRRARVKVVNAQGGRLSLWRSMLRSAVKFLPWQLAHTCVIFIWFGYQSPLLLVGALAAQGLAILYITCVWLSPRHQAPYDWLAGTSVIVVE